MNILIKTLTGTVEELLVDPSDSIALVKEKAIAKIPTIDINSRVISAGKQLEPQKSLADYGITKNQALHFIPPTKSQMSSASAASTESNTTETEADDAFTTVTISEEENTSEAKKEQEEEQEAEGDELSQIIKRLLEIPTPSQETINALQLSPHWKKAAELLTLVGNSVTGVKLETKRENLPCVLSKLKNSSKHLEYLKGKKITCKLLFEALRRVRDIIPNLADVWKPLVAQYCDQIESVAISLRECKNAAADDVIVKLMSEFYNAIGTVLDTKPLDQLLAPVEHQMQNEVKQSQQVCDEYKTLLDRDEAGCEMKQASHRYLYTIKKRISISAEKTKALKENEAQHNSFNPINLQDAGMNEQSKVFKGENNVCEKDLQKLSKAITDVDAKFVEINKAKISNILALTENIKELEERGKKHLILLNAILEAEKKREEEVQRTNKLLEFEKKELERIDKLRNKRIDGCKQREVMIKEKVSDNNILLTAIDQLRDASNTLVTELAKQIEGCKTEHNTTSLNVHIERYELFLEAYPIVFNEKRGIELTIEESKTKSETFDTRIFAAKQMHQHSKVDKLKGKKAAFTARLNDLTQELEMLNETQRNLDETFTDIHDNIYNIAKSMDIINPNSSEDCLFIDYEPPNPNSTNFASGVYKIEHPGTNLEIAALKKHQEVLESMFLSESTAKQQTADTLSAISQRISVLSQRKLGN